MFWSWGGGLVRRGNNGWHGSRDPGWLHHARICFPTRRHRLLFLLLILLLVFLLQLLSSPLPAVVQRWVLKIKWKQKEKKKKKLKIPHMDFFFFFWFKLKNSERKRIASIAGPGKVNKNKIKTFYWGTNTKKCYFFLFPE